MRFPLLSALAFALAAAAPAQIVTKLECGVPVDGFVDANSPIQRFLFNVPEKNEAIAIRFLNTTKAPDDPKQRAFSANVFLRDPNGIRLVPRAASAFGNTGAEFDLVDAGDYLIDVEAGFAGAVGSFRLLRTRLKGPCASTALVCGVPAKGAIAGNAVVNSYRFEGEKDDLISLRLRKTTTIVTPDDRSASFALVAYGLDGVPMLTVDNPPKPAAIGTSASVPWLKMDIRLPATGGYTFLVFESSNATRTGTYSLVAARLNGGCRAKPAGCGTTLEGELSEPLAVDAYTIRAGAGDSFLLRRARIGSGTNLRLLMEIYDPAGKAVVPDSSSVDVTRVGFNAATAGAYTVLMSDDLRFDGTQTGRYALAFARLNNPCNAQALDCGSVADGRIDGTLRFSTWSFTAEANDTFLVRLMRTDLNTSFKPRVEVYDPQGALLQLTSTTDLARFTFKAPAAGSYTVLASDGMDGTRTGGFAISLARLNRPCNATALGCASLASGSIAAPLRFTAYSYTPAAGESFTLRMIETAGSLQETLEVYDPQGNAAGAPVPGNVPGLDVVRPSAGPYTILAMDGGKTPNQGSFTLQLYRTRNACVAAPPQGGSQRGVVTGNAPYGAYALPVAAGDALLVRSASLTENFNAALDLYDPEGVRVASGTFALNAAVKAAGSYTLIVGASSPRTTGSYALSWQLMNRPAGTLPLVCGQTVGGILSPDRQFRYYTASAESGDILKLLLTRVSDGFAPQLELYNLSGTRLALATADLSRKVPDAGDYLVLVSPASAVGETGAYALAFQKPNRPCAAVSLACGQSAPRAVEAPGQLDAFTFPGTAGQRVVLRLPTRSGNVSPFIELYDPAGNLLSSGALAFLARDLAATGDFALLVRDRAGTGSGTYRVSFQHEPQACPVDDSEKPTIRLRRPTGGEVISGGSAFRIQWESDDNVDVASHEIRFSTDGGQTFPTLLAGALGGTVQSYDWQVPADIAPGRSAVIQVTADDASGNVASASSDLLAVLGSGFTENTTVTYEYDGLDRISKAIYQDGLVAQYVYDAAGNLVEVQVTRP